MRARNALNSQNKTQPQDATHHLHFAYTVNSREIENSFQLITIAGIMINLISFYLIVVLLAAAAITPYGFVLPTRTSMEKILCTPLHAKDANMSDEEREAAMEKALKAMTAFSNKYVQNTNTYFCQDKSVPAVVIKGLAEHKVTLGTPLCPCRFYEDKEKEAKEGYW